jgi:DNA-nicking Smr family endonuclease
VRKRQTEKTGSKRKRPSISSEVHTVAAVAIPVKAAPASSKRDFKKSMGLDGSTAERLRRGKVEPQATLDLHGLTQSQAHLKLVTFVRRCAESELRCILVVTGKGAPARTASQDDVAFEMPARPRSGVLKEMVPRWLQDGDVRAFVAGTQTAHIRHGGAGAVYVYLRRRRN